MPHKIFHDSELDIIQVQYQGELTITAAKELIAQTAAVASEKSCRLVLLDMRQAVVKVSITNLFELPGFMSGVSANQNLNTHLLKRAVIAIRDLPAYHFFETVTLNRGQNVRVFTDPSQAYEWLLAGKRIHSYGS